MSGLKIIIMALACSCLMACATASLPNTATDSEKRAALCSDAKAAYAMAQKAFMLKADPSTEASLYWSAFSQGASIGISTYCGGTP